MRGQNLIALSRSPKIWLAALLALAVFTAFALPLRAVANDLPLAAGSPLTGLSFDDRPLLLPVQRNFQMAMLTASTQIGRSCGRMESYGWRTAQSEQNRVNLIFSNTVDRLRGLGFAVEAQNPTSISKDITLFTADRKDKHFLFMWSAGEIGLVMVLCESSPPLTGRMAELYNAAPAEIIPPPPQEVMQSKLETPAMPAKNHSTDNFTPVGSWVGSYTCMRGYTGATMHIDPFKGEDFKGTFRFYPTTKNAYIPKGSYEIYGQYDKQSKRMLINPGKWGEHPNGYYKTIIVGSFDPELKTFSGFFQGILGCTSFEAKYDARSAEVPGKKIGVKAKKKSVKKAAAKKPVDDAKTAVPSGEAPAPIPDAVPPVTDDIKLPSGATPAAPVSAPTPSSAAPAPVVAPPAMPASVPVTPAPVPVPAAAIPADAPTPITPAPVPTPDMAPAPTSDLPPAATPATSKPTSSLAPRPGPHAIVLAGDWPPGPSAQSVPATQEYNLKVQTLQPANMLQPVTPVQPVRPYIVTPPQLAAVQKYDVNVPKVPDTQPLKVDTDIRPAQAYSTEPVTVLPSPIYNAQIPQLSETQTYSIYKAPGS